MSSKARRRYSETSCYVIAYDIPDDRRRTKVHQILMGFGKWTQYSLFECFLSKTELRAVTGKAGRAPGGERRQRALLPLMRQLRREGRDDWRSSPSRGALVCGIAELIAGRRNCLAERGPAPGSRSRLT